VKKGCIEGCEVWKGGFVMARQRKDRLGVDRKPLGLWNGTIQMAGLSNVEAFALLIFLVLSFCSFKLARIIITHIPYSLFRDGL
jgi:hypothetical protein